MLFFAFLGLWLASVAFATNERVVQAKQNCARGVHIIAARGNGTAQGYGIMLPMVIALKDAIPHSTNVSVTYPKDGSTQEGNTVGTEHQKRLIEDYAQKCPNTPIVLVGYSEGAGLTMNTLCGTSNAGFEETAPLPKKFRDNVLAAVVYGDYTYVNGQSYDKGTCNNPSLYARQSPRDCAPVADKIRSYCNAKDPICCSTGDDKRQHYTYFKKYDTKMANWVKQQFQRGRK